MRTALIAWMIAAAIGAVGFRELYSQSLTHPARPPSLPFEGDLPSSIRPLLRAESDASAGHPGAGRRLRRDGPAVRLLTRPRPAPVDRLLRRRPIHLDLAPRPDGRWRFYESAQPEFACSRWFGHGVQESTVVDIDVAWDAPDVLHVSSPGLVGWRLTLGSSPMTHLMNGGGRLMPLAAWRSTAVLRLMGAAASATLGVGKVGLTGLTANGLPVDANPWRIWRVAKASATINGEDASAPAPLPEQARLGDFWIPQQGIFAMGRVFVDEPVSSDPAT